VASAGSKPPDAGTEAYAPGEDLVGRCAAALGDQTFGERIVTREPFAETSPKFQRIFQTLIKADTEIAYVPLSGPNRTYGVLRCIAGRFNNEEIRFSREDLDGLDEYAHLVSTSISSLRRKVELDVLTRASKLLADQPQNVRRVYDLVTSALVAESTEYAACSIRIRDRRGDLVLESLSGASGMNMIEKERATRRSDVGLAAEAFSTGKPVIVNDVQRRVDRFHDPRWLRENRIVTAAVFPIYLADDNIGVLALYLWYPYAFYHSKREFIENLCHQVATATRVVHLSARQRLIERMSAIISSSGTADKLLQTILDAACDLTAAWQGYISLISRRDANLQPKVTTRHLSPDDIPSIDVNGKGLTAIAVRNKASVRVGDVRLDPDYVDFKGQAEGKTRSELVVPLLHEHVLGVIALQSDQVDDFSQTDQLLIETLSQYATLVFQRDRLYEGTKTLAEIDFPRASRERVMGVIAKSAVQLVDADAAILRTYNGATRELMLETYHPDTMNAEDVPTAMQRDVGACWDALRMRDVLKFDDLPNSPRFHNQDFVKSNGFTDMASVPLLLPGEDPESPTELGVINVFFRTPSPFFDVERQLLGALGVSASYAIHDLLIIERASRAQTLATITAQTTAALDLSSKLAHQALRPLRDARLAMESIRRAVRRQDLVGIPTPLSKLETHIGSLESLIGQLAPKNPIGDRGGDQIEVLSEAFRLMHTNLFASSGRPHLNIGETELWDEIKSALRRVINLVRLPLAAAYISSHRDYSALRRVVATRGNNPPGVDTVTLRSSEEFAWLANHTHVILPIHEGHFAWLDPQNVIGTPGAVLYGHEVTGGRLMIVVLGTERDRTLGFEDLAMLYDSVAVQIFTYVDNAMFGIELDFLTSETGHLMGRAIGKVESGTRALKQILQSSDAPDPTLKDLAKSAVEDGVTRLQLIRNNFYWFSAQRRYLDNTTGAAGEKVGRDQIDICSMLREMLAMFRREAADRGLKPTRLESRERTAVVSGPEDLLRLTFLNIYDNALKFAYANTFIDIRLFREGDNCIVMFVNLGVGVARDELKTVFERLRRSRFRDPSKRVEGLGLGLAYCRRVVEEIFKGHIDLVSHAADTPRGPRFDGDNWLTTVTVTVPLLDPGRRKDRKT